MKIYAAYLGNHYKGGSPTNQMFRKKADAVIECQKCANKFNDLGDRYIQEGDIWRDGNDFIKVREYNLV